MSFRRRVVLLSAGGVAVAIALACALVYVLTAQQLSAQVDQNLRNALIPGQATALRVQTTVQGRLAKLLHEGRLAALPPGLKAGTASGSAMRAVPMRVAPGGEASSSLTTPTSSPRTRAVLERALVARGGGPALPESLPQLEGGGIAQLVLPAKGLGGVAGYAELIQSNGKVLHSETKGGLVAPDDLPETAAVRAVAAGRRGSFFHDVTIDGTHMRVLVERASSGGVWQVALPLTDTLGTLSRLRLVLAIVLLAGIALAAGLGLLIARGAVRPVRRLTGAAERVARTQDLGHRIHVGGQDELGRLSASFNTMLAALEHSRLAQRQLISDASHELRTPLTSIQANLDALALGERLPAPERSRVLANAQAQLRELAALVGDLVELSRTEFEELELEDVRLDLAAEGALQRARLHAPACSFELESSPCLVRTAPGRLDRAIANLLDNAVKWGPAGGPVEVRVRDGAVQVRDHGPGIDAADLPRVFDRFYRAPAARARPGSGLGLAIVRQVAEASGGSVHAANHPGGGAVLTLELPGQALELPQQAPGLPQKTPGEAQRSAAAALAPAPAPHAADLHGAERGAGLHEAPRAL